VRGLLTAAHARPAPPPSRLAHATCRTAAPPLTRTRPLLRPAGLSRFCEGLFGHYLLPNGSLAHFYLGDTVVKGHRVDLTPAPSIPIDPEDWVHDGLPACSALRDCGATTTARLALPGRSVAPLASPPLCLSAQPCAQAPGRPLEQDRARLVS
jgi:hypothetical protein